MISDRHKLLVIGISHKTSKIAEREIFQVTRKEIRPALIYFKSIRDVEGIVIVSTCNRFEFYLVLNNKADPFTLLNDFYKSKNIKNVSVTKDSFYVFEGINAARHLFKVTAGLDSMIVGEYQVQGQIKDAYSIACSEKTADKILHKLFHAAFRTGKAIRANTKIGEGNLSLSGVACKLLKERLNRTDPITIIGVNQNTKIIAQKLNESGFSCFNFVNRTTYKAEEMADKFGGKAFSLNHLEKVLPRSRCIVSCTGSPDFIIQADLLNKVYSETGYPELVIDMAVPHDIDLRGLKHNVEYCDLEGLSRYLEDEKREVILDIPEAERIVTEESRLFEVWNEAQTDNTYDLLDEKIETIRLQLLNELKNSHTESDIKLLDKFSHSLIHRLKSIITQTIKINLGDTGIYKAG